MIPVAVKRDSTSESYTHDASSQPLLGSSRRVQEAAADLPYIERTQSQDELSANSLICGSHLLFNAITLIVNAFYSRQLALDTFSPVTAFDPKPLAPETSIHFTLDDIQRLTNVNMGMRHVSSRQVALHEKAHGFKMGSAFNLTFERSEHLEKSFENLPEELHSLPPDQQKKCLGDYERAINSHFSQSIIFDIGPQSPGKTFGEICEKLKETCFLLIDYDRFSPTDIRNFGGLGRFPKKDIDPESIKAILPFFDSPPAGVDPAEVIQNERQYEAFFELIVDQFRERLLTALRRPDLDFINTNRCARRTLGL